jgi:hypothetical protein
MMMTKEDPGSFQVTLGRQALATVSPASCHGLMYVQKFVPYLTICMHVTTVVFITRCYLNFASRILKNIIKNNACAL